MGEIFKKYVFKINTFVVVVNVGRTHFILSTVVQQHPFLRHDLKMKTQTLYVLLSP